MTVSRRRPLAVLVAWLLAVVVLVGCSTEDETPEEPPPPTIAVSGAFGRTPVVSFTPPLELTEAENEVLIEGEGRALEAGGPALLALSAYDGDTGELLPDQGGGHARTLLLTPEEVGEDVYPLLLGAAEGTRLLVTQPVAADEGERMLVLVIDVLHTVAQGEELEQREDLPTVTQEDGGVAITLPDTEPPSSLEVETIIRGGGRQVAPGQAVTMQYVAVTWPGGDIYDSTWADGKVPRTVMIDETFAGLRDGLVDQTVGSRVLVVIPPALGTGAQTLVFAVDVLAASDVAMEEPAEGTEEPAPSDEG